MKKQVQDFIKRLGGSSSYSGKSRTLYINDPGKNNPDIKTHIEFKIHRHFSSLPFSTQTK